MIEEKLVRNGIITKEQRDHVLAYLVENGGSFSEGLLALGLIKDPNLLHIIAQEFGMNLAETGEPVGEDPAEAEEEGSAEGEVDSLELTSAHPSEAFLDQAPEALETIPLDAPRPIQAPRRRPISLTSEGWPVVPDQGNAPPRRRPRTCLE